VVYCGKYVSKLKETKATNVVQLVEIGGEAKCNELHNNQMFKCMKKGFEVVDA
jgi:hypothetical protein